MLEGRLGKAITEGRCLAEQRPEGWTVGQPGSESRPAVEKAGDVGPGAWLL